MAQALGATPAALLAGGTLEQDFDLEAAAGGATAWTGCRPCRKAQGRRVPVAARRLQGKDLAALEIVDSFGQRSLLRFTALERQRRAGAASSFRFTPPKGADVIEQ